MCSQRINIRCRKQNQARLAPAKPLDRHPAGASESRQKEKLMSGKTIVFLGLKVMALTMILFLCFAVASIVSDAATPPTSAEPPSDMAQTTDPTGTSAALLIVCAFQAIVLSYPIIRSRWTGWPLIMAIFFVHYVVMTFLSQIETVVFLNYLVNVVPTEMIPGLFVQGAVVAAPFAPLAVLIHGKMKEPVGEKHPARTPSTAERTEGSQKPNQRLVMPWTEWTWKLALIAIIYVVIYLSFGAFVFMPLAGDAFQSYYGDLQGPGWILPLQVVRAFIWVASALPIIRMMKGQWWEAGLAIALLFSVLMGFLLLMPNPFMPDAIRQAHFIEVSSSNFLFGWIVVWLLNRHHSSLRDLF
jgi:hypothetical protein